MTLKPYMSLRFWVLGLWQVQHPGIQELMMTDIRNLQAFALYMQKTDIKFDLYSVTKEMETQVAIFFLFFVFLPFCRFKWLITMARKTFEEWRVSYLGIREGQSWGGKKTNFHCQGLPGQLHLINQFLMNHFRSLEYNSTLMA